MKLDDVNPVNRKPPKKIDKTILLISGKSYDGKTFLATNLINSNIEYLSLDLIILENTGIVSIEKFKKRYKPLKIYIDLINKHISENCTREFIDFLFKDFINKTDKNLILIDGELLTYDLILNEIKEHSKNNAIRLWLTQKINT